MIYIDSHNVEISLSHLAYLSEINAPIVQTVL